MSTRLFIRELSQADPPVIAEAFQAQGWRKSTEQYARYLRECEDGGRTVLLAFCDGVFAGYITILWTSHYPPFAQAGIPEIADFNVLKVY